MKKSMLYLMAAALALAMIMGVPAIASSDGGSGKVIATIVSSQDQTNTDGQIMIAGACESGQVAMDPTLFSLASHDRMASENFCVKMDAGELFMNTGPASGVETNMNTVMVSFMADMVGTAEMANIAEQDGFADNVWMTFTGVSMNLKCPMVSNFARI